VQPEINDALMRTIKHGAYLKSKEKHCSRLTTFPKPLTFAAVVVMFADRAATSLGGSTLSSVDRAAASLGGSKLSSIDRAAASLGDSKLCNLK